MGMGIHEAWHAPRSRRHRSSGSARRPGGSRSAERPTRRPGPAGDGHRPAADDPQVALGRARRRGRGRGPPAARTPRGPGGHRSSSSPFRRSFAAPWRTALSDGRRVRKILSGKPNVVRGRALDQSQIIRPHLSHHPAGDAHDDGTGRHLHPGVTTDPAPMTQSGPTVAPFSTTARMPTSTRSPSVAP